MPGQPFRSKLNPHIELIRDLRRRQKTWKEIAEILETEHGVQTHPSSVLQFFKRRSKGRRPLGFEDGPPETVSQQKLPPNRIPSEDDFLRSAPQRDLFAELEARRKQKPTQ